MIESFNNIIFWIGYLAILSGLLLFISFCFYGIYKNVLDSNFIFRRVFNHLFDKRLKDCTEDDFEKWVEDMRVRFKKVKDKK